MGETRLHPGALLRTEQAGVQSGREAMEAPPARLLPPARPALRDPAEGTGCTPAPPRPAAQRPCPIPAPLAPSSDKPPQMAEPIRLRSRLPLSVEHELRRSSDFYGTSNGNNHVEKELLISELFNE